MGSRAPANCYKSLIAPWNSTRSNQPAFQQWSITHHAHFEDPHGEEAEWSFMRQQHSGRTGGVHVLLGTSDWTSNRVVPVRGRIGRKEFASTKNNTRSPSPATHKRPCVEFQEWSLGAWDVVERELSGASSMSLRLTLPKEGWLSKVPCQRLVRHIPGIINVYLARYHLFLQEVKRSLIRRHPA